MNLGSAKKWADLILNTDKKFHFGYLKSSDSYCLFGILEDFINPMTELKWDEVSYKTIEGSAFFPSKSTLKKCKFKCDPRDLVIEFEDKISVSLDMTVKEQKEYLSKYIMDNYERF